MKHVVAITAGIVVLGAFLLLAFPKNAGMEGDYDTTASELVMTEVIAPEGRAVATFAAGCFWCSEAVFQETAGIDDVASGYAGGQEVDPVYEDVYKNRTGHREAVQFFYDPDVISYAEILDILWQVIDPTDDGGQFVDRGFAYTTAVFYHDDTQKAAVEASITALDASGRFDAPIVTEILPFTTFYRAEEYHQDFYINSPARYIQYEENSGREEYKAAIWEDIQSQELSN